MRPLILLFSLALQFPVSAADFPETVIERIACGSCAHQDKKMPIFAEILAQDPDIFLFTGDNIYGDSDDMEVLKQKYAKLDSKPEFAALRKKVPIVPAWDDHDYGKNDAGAEFPVKAESQKVFADFWQLPADSPVRSREGTYDVYNYGPPEKRVQIIVLDTRYFRGPLVRAADRKWGQGPYGPNLDPTATVLGDAQWDWLEQQLKQPTQIRLIVSSIQFVTDQHQWELWENFPLERKRMLKLLDETNAGPIIFVSGDRHLSEISKMTTPEGVPVWDITASSLTNPGGGNANEPNPYRMSEGNFRGLNFGMINIDWGTEEGGGVDLQILDDKGEVVFDIPAWKRSL